MVQESVYSKLALNMTVANGIISNIRKNSPETGLVQLLVVTEKQYGKMEFIVGNRQTEILESDERLVVF